MRLLHTMLRVGDLQRSIDFYTKVLGMKLLRTSENPEYKYSLAFVGYGPETEEAVIEYCREHLARFKVPKKVFFGPLPKTSTGKLQKYLLRQQMKSASAIG